MPSCTLCGEPGEEYCLACRLEPLLSGRVISAGTYEGAAERAIKAYKYLGKRRLATPLGARLVSRLQVEYDSSCSQWDLVIPIPSSGRSLAARGFHHTMGLAKIVAGALGIPLARWSLNFNRATVAQATLLPKSRWDNLEGVLTADARRIAEKRVLLVDDVLTTGATLSEADRALAAAGAIRADAITIVRSQHCQQYRLEHLRERSCPCL